MQQIASQATPYIDAVTRVMKLPPARLNLLSNVLNWLETEDEMINADAWQIDLALLRAELKKVHPFATLPQDDIDDRLAKIRQEIADELYPDLP